jgi:cobalamin biosynthesis protein CobW
VQQLLKQAQRDGIRLAIVSNEFGDTGIDRALLDAGEEGFVELDGGCVCCRLSDKLSETLETLLTTVKPDRLVLETSGVALPGEIVIQFWRDPLDELISDEVVAIVVDVERVMNGIPQDETFREQLEAADIVVLNKIDLVDPDAVDRAEAILSEATHGQPVLRAVQGNVDAALLFPPDPEGARQDRRDPDAEMHAHTHEQFQSMALTYEGEQDIETLRTALESRSALRVKGFVNTADGVMLVQGVGPRINIGPPDTAVPAHLVGTVVVIDRQIP